MVDRSIANLEITGHRTYIALLLMADGSLRTRYCKLVPNETDQTRLRPFTPAAAAAAAARKQVFSYHDDTP